MMMVQSHRFAATAALALSLCVGIGAAAAQAPSKSADHTIVIDSVRFEPQALTVKVGDTVTWVNKDPFPHTATSPAGGFDSKEIVPGKSWRHTASKPGVFPYACTLHPTMKGTLTVHTR